MRNKQATTRTKHIDVRYHFVREFCDRNSDDVVQGPSSHKNRKVNDKFFEWLNKKYGSIKAVKATRGDKHKYLGMTVNFEKRGCVRFKQFDKVEDLIENGPVRLKEVIRLWHQVVII